MTADGPGMPLPHWQDDSVQLFHGDCLDVLRALPDSSVDSVVTDPPYGLEFMGKEWDRLGAPIDKRLINDPAAVMGNQDSPNGGNAFSRSRIRFGQGEGTGAAQQAWHAEWVTECLRVLKPGGHLLAFGGTRTWHRLACAVEDAGFEVRDSIAWVYGSGFPKSLDVSKAIDKAATINDETVRRIAAVAEVIRTHREAAGLTRAEVSLAVVGTASGACWNWEHQQLPSAEMWPAIKATLSIPNTFDGLIDGNRARFIAAEREVIGRRTTGIGTGNGAVAYIADSENRDITAPATPAAEQWQGWGTALKPAFEPVVVARKPLAGTVAANVLAHGTGALNIDGCRVLAEPWTRPGGENAGKRGGIMGETVARVPSESNAAGRWPANVLLDGSQADAVGDEGRFFPVFRYEAKAPTVERPRDGDVAHPTVKPLDLMRWLVRLVTPPGGLVLEPFAGSGTTAEACVIEGFRCLAIEREATYLPLIIQRLSKPLALDLFGGME